MRDDSDVPADLLAFRNRLYSCMPRRADALFGLSDAILAIGTTPSMVHLSLAPTHRRGWVSLYAALSKGLIDRNVLRELLVGDPLAGAPDRTRVYAVDRSSWPRCDAECSPLLKATSCCGGMDLAKLSRISIFFGELTAVASTSSTS